MTRLEPCSKDDVRLAGSDFRTIGAADSSIKRTPSHFRRRSIEESPSLSVLIS
jgi:hypothetical protein